VNSLPKTVIRQRRDCDFNPGPSAPQSSTLTTGLPSRPIGRHTTTNPFMSAREVQLIPSNSLRQTVHASRAELI